MMCHFLGECEQILKLLTCFAVCLAMTRWALSVRFTHIHGKHEHEKGLLFASSARWCTQSQNTNMKLRGNTWNKCADKYNQIKCSLKDLLGIKMMHYIPFLSLTIINRTSTKKMYFVKKAVHPSRSVRSSVSHVKTFVEIVISVHFKNHPSLT